LYTYYKRLVYTNSTEAALKDKLFKTGKL